MIEDVTNTKWYNDPCANIIFHHLAYNAFFADGLVYKQGQCKFSVADLCRVFPFTAKQINLAIKKLEKDGAIETQGTPSGTIFTIIKYLRFASEKETNERENKKTNERENENYNNIYIDNNNNILVCDNTREDEKKWFAQMKRQFTAWQADACRVLKIDQATLATYIEDFEAECRAKNTTHVSWQNITSHLIDWARIQVEKQRKTANYEKTNDRGRTFETNATSASDFYKSV